MGEVRLHLVGGAPRSGTTLLQAVLCSARDTSPLLGECPFLCQLLDFYAAVTSSWEDDSRYYFDAPADAAAIARHAVGSIFGPVAARHGSAAVVTKSPGLSLRAATISAVLPQATCYAILRDVRDVIALQLAATAREVQNGFPPTLLEPGTIAPGDDIRREPRVVEALADRFRRHYDETVLSSWHLVSYEVLVTRPGPAIESLRAASGLDIAFDPGQPWRHVEFDYLRTSRTAESAWRSDLWGRPVDASRVGLYKTVLPDRQVRMIERRCAAYLEVWRSLSGVPVGRSKSSG